MRLSSVIIALAGGTAVAWAMGLFAWQPVADAPWLTLPKLAGIDYPLQFSLPDVLTDRKSTRLNSSHLVISYAVFCLKKKSKADTRGTAPPTSTGNTSP